MNSNTIIGRKTTIEAHHKHTLCELNYYIFPLKSLMNKENIVGCSTYVDGQNSYFYWFDTEEDKLKFILKYCS